MYYFVKDNCIHKYPVPKMCTVQKENETLRDTVIHGVEECPYCFRRWPGVEDYTGN